MSCPVEITELHESGDLRYRKVELPNLSAISNCSNKSLRIKLKYHSPELLYRLQGNAEMFIDHDLPLVVYISGSEFFTRRLFR